MPKPKQLKADRRALKNGGTLQEEADDNSWKNWFSNIWSALTSDEHLPKRFRLFIKKYGKEKVKSVQMVRAPVAKPAIYAMQLLTAGNFNEFKRKAGIDAVYHTGIVFNGNLVVEKLEKLEGRQDASYLNQGGKAEVFDVPLQGKELTIAEFLENGRKKMGTNFYTYSVFGGNSCQDFVANIVSANGLMTPEGQKFIKQDIDKLVKELPQITQVGAKAVTDKARDLTNVGEELLYKRGGVIQAGSYNRF